MATTRRVAAAAAALAITFGAVGIGGTAAEAKDIKPGAYCSPVGAVGYYHGKRYICSLKSASGKPYKGGRAHWRRG